MLILSRRVNESIDFPALGITVSVASVQGSRVRIGITAPPHISVMRSELKTTNMPLPSCMQASHDHGFDHHTKNQLNRATLGIQLAQRQLAIGQSDRAEQSLNKALQVLSDLELKQKNIVLSDSIKSEKQLSAQQTLEPAAKEVSEELVLKPWNLEHKKVDVLLVEDDDNERALLQALLENAGYSVQTASDGLQALECLGNIQPRVVLMDMMMPRSSGKQAIDRIRAFEHLQYLPICVVSGSSPDSVGLSENCRIDDWFPKPLNARLLIDRLGSKVLTASSTN